MLDNLRGERVLPFDAPAGTETLLFCKKEEVWSSDCNTEGFSTSSTFPSESFRFSAVPAAELSPKRTLCAFFLSAIAGVTIHAPGGAGVRKGKDVALESDAGGVYNSLCTSNGGLVSSVGIISALTGAGVWYGVDHAPGGRGVFASPILSRFMVSGVRGVSSLSSSDEGGDPGRSGKSLGVAGGLKSNLAAL